MRLGGSNITTETNDDGHGRAFLVIWNDRGATQIQLDQYEVDSHTMWLREVAERHGVTL